ncbi:hypothetical protein BH11MYX1_BH11MYX1_22970 [soil metagenome]
MFRVGQASAEENPDVGFVANMALSPEAIDQGLREIAKKKRTLDRNEMFLLSHAVRRQIWAAFGRASMLEYLEEIFGYSPKVARDRLRVARAIEELPVLAEMLESGEQHYAALRELTRVTTPATVDSWRDAARGMSLRQIEQLVSGRKQGDLPSDSPDSDLVLDQLSFEVLAVTRARVRQARQVMSDEYGGFVDDDAFINALCVAFLDGRGGDEGRARHQIMTTVCEQCSRGWQDAAGQVIAIDTIGVELAECDAQRVGSDREAERATQDIAPKVRRFVWRRDHGKCCVPSCRASRNIDIHHVVHRAHGGNHEASNLLLLCGGHHRALHEGKLLITGLAPDLTFAYARRSPPSAHVGHPSESPNATEAEDPGAEAEATPHGGHPIQTLRPTAPTPCGEPSRYERVVVATQAKRALTQLGFLKGEARRYVEDALANTSGVPPLEQLIIAALQNSRR